MPILLASYTARLQALEKQSDAIELMLVKYVLFISSEILPSDSVVEIAKIVSPSIGVWDG